jgi:hypothetical protein
LNISGTNTLTGTLFYLGGGNTYNFGSDAGTLVIQSDLNFSAVAGTRYFTFQHAGSIAVNGNIIDTSTGTNPSAAVVKYDSGTTTLNGSGNSNLGNFSIYAGTLALGPSFAATFVQHEDDVDEFDPRNMAPISPEGDAPRINIDAGATFDVSAKAGGFNLTQTLQGKGAVKGTINMASGTLVRPGAGFYHSPTNEVEVFGTDEGVGTLTIQGGSTADYNNNGVVDAADYVLWRKNPAAFGGTPGGYTAWRAGFGSSGGAGVLNLSAGSKYVWSLGALSTNNPGTDFDQIVINNGNLTLGGTSALTLDLALISDPNAGDSFWNSTHSWKIIDTTSNTGNTNFASITNGTFNLGHFTTTVGTGGNVGDIFLNYVLGAGSGLGSGAVPEPASASIMLCGLCGAFWIRRR